jgi:hypothetical protein
MRVHVEMHDFSVSAALEGRPWEYEDLGGPMALEVEKVVKDLPAWRPGKTGG